MGCTGLFFFFMFGWGLTGNLLGGLFGLGVGLWINRLYLERLAVKHKAQADSIRALFLLCVMSSFAKIAKADGRISESEIDVVEGMLNEWGLNDEERSLAKDVFRRAKDDDMPFAAHVAKFAAECPDYGLKSVFLLCLVRLACAEGPVSHAKMGLLLQAESLLRLPSGAVRMMMAQFFSRSDPHGGTRRSWRQEDDENPLYSVPSGASDDDYAAIGVQPSASDDQVKKAYRQKAMELHPDRIQAKGLPPNLIKMANDQLALVNAAYDRICRARGIK